MNKEEAVRAILKEQRCKLPVVPSAEAFAPANIALCKYWGKRNQELHLPETSSLSLSLGGRGTRTRLSWYHGERDRVIADRKVQEETAPFAARIIRFLDLFRPSEGIRFEVDTESNIPVGAGLASSASGFAALVLALHRLLGWELASAQLSLLARLGSGSACRSLWQGFVEWRAGTREDGMDSWGEPLVETWEGLCIGLLIVSSKEKPVGSREAMARTRQTSPFYDAWPRKAEGDLAILKGAIRRRDMALLGRTAESNALAMHALMLSSWPPLSYSLPGTLEYWERVWALRREGVPLYFTQDAGPNLKLLFLEEDLPRLQPSFPEMEVVRPFGVTVHKPDFARV